MGIKNLECDCKAANCFLNPVTKNNLWYRNNRDSYTSGVIEKEKTNKSIPIVPLNLWL